MTTYPQDTVNKWRKADLMQVLSLMGLEVKHDSTYRPRKNPQSQRWHVAGSGGVYELVVPGGVLWFDTRARRGGRGAVDLVMHIAGLGFVQALQRLEGLSHGQA